MTSYGYVRKGFPYTETKQLQQVIKYECDELFFEQRNLEESAELAKLITRLRAEDTLIVATLRVFGDDLEHLIPYVQQLQQQKIKLISINENLDSSKDIYFYFLFERLIIDRDEDRASFSTRRGNRNREVVTGRPTIDAKLKRQIFELYNNQKMTMRQIVDECNVSLGTVSKYSKKVEAVASDLRE